MLKFRQISDIKAKIEFDEEYRRDFDLLRSQFKVENAALRFIQTTKFKGSDFIYAISPLGQYAIGMTDEIMNKCEDLQIEYEIDEELYNSINPSFDIEEIQNVPNETYQYRDYQLNLIKALSDKGRGVIISPTRSRKIISNCWAYTQCISKCKKIKNSKCFNISS